MITKEITRPVIKFAGDTVIQDYWLQGDARKILTWN